MAHLEVVRGKLALVDSAGLETRGAETDFLSVPPLLVELSSSENVSGRSNGSVDVDVASAETTDAGNNDVDTDGTLTGVAEEDVGDDGVSETVVLAGSETGRDGEGVGNTTDRAEELDVVGQTTGDVGVGSVDVKTLVNSQQTVR